MTGWRRHFPQRVFINPLDAKARGIKDGDSVQVFNQRGTMILPCRITPRIMPGVVDIPQGAWYEPDEQGIDRGGCVNMLTSHRWTPFAYASTQHTIMVQVEKAGKRYDQAAICLSLDARFCSGCKACQAACKDKNSLPPRRALAPRHGDQWRHLAAGGRRLEQQRIRLQPVDGLQSLHPSQVRWGFVPRMPSSCAKMALSFWMSPNAWDADIVPGAVRTALRNTIRKPVT